MVMLRLPFWSTLSSTPVTVTVCPVFQLDGVKVKVAGLTVAAAGARDRTLISTLVDGWISNATV